MEIHIGKSTWIYMCVLATLVFITYLNSLNNAFLSDDLAEIVNNPNISNLGHAISTHPFGFLRPLFYWVAYHIGGLNPIIFRLINISFHLGSVILIFFLIRLLHSSKAAFFTASLVAIHPALSEPVVWISGGSYQQYAFFFILSFIFYILSAKKSKFLWFSLFYFLLAFMSHFHIPISLFLIFLLYEFCFGNLRKNWIRVLPFLILTFIYLGVNLAGLPERETTLQNVHLQEKGMDNPFYTIPIAISSYLELLFWPQSLTLYHSELAFSQIGFAIKVILTFLFFSLILFSFKKNRIIFFWTSFFLIALSPTLTPFRLNWIVAERYLYLPSLGIFALIGIGLTKLSEKNHLRNIVYPLFAILIILLSARTIIRNMDWQDENHLWIATGKTSPSSPNNHNNLGDVYGRLGDKQRAIQEFQTAITLKPNYADAYHNLANAYRETDQMDKALENYQNALKFNPNLWQSYQNIAAIYFEQKNYDKSLEYIQKALMISPDNINLAISLGVIYLGKGEKIEAKQVFNKILSVDPQNIIARQGLIETNK